MSEQQVLERATIEQGQLVMPFYLIFDVSCSMQSDMPALNDGVRRLRRAIVAEPVVDDVAQVYIMTFSDTAKVVMPLGQMSESEVPALAVEGGTKYGVAFRALNGLELGEETGLLPGTAYPILMRLEDEGWATSWWEDISPEAEGRPRRRYYRLTANLGCAGQRGHCGPRQPSREAPRSLAGEGGYA